MEIYGEQSVNYASNNATNFSDKDKLDRDYYN